MSISIQHHFELSDSDFEAQFANCTLDAKLFTHEAHIRLAWILIQKHGIRLAEEKIQEQIKDFVKSVGALDKYNTTLTIAAIRIVNCFMQKSNSESFKDFIVDFPKLKTDFKSLIKSHYSIDVFTSDKAKKEFLAPDLLPL
ncbi:hypothetical protein M0D21_11565 [Aquimarina sp. D1M17]|uniref:hypothetical protein n=1 Tax=Aquimarina acroporae TaxID=2937283 RepID=UPI0020BF5778|nr:hypothetical protein [Aquimarina acroporae]MCK8522212.1 hypothetical protein [Aquimarina acroporae]